MPTTIIADNENSEETVIPAVQQNQHPLITDRQWGLIAIVACAAMVYGPLAWWYFH